LANFNVTRYTAFMLDSCGYYHVWAQFNSLLSTLTDFFLFDDVRILGFAFLQFNSFQRPTLHVDLKALLDSFPWVVTGQKNVLSGVTKIPKRHAPALSYLHRTRQFRANN